MKYLIAALAAFFMSAANADQAKVLHFQLSENVVISITNVGCPIPKYKHDFPWAAVATRKDGAQLVGCYAPKNIDDIVIQWDDIDGQPSDQSIIPANAFLPKATL
jgi:hypothetical protein